jgi:hypothetical protein
MTTEFEKTSIIDIDLWTIENFARELTHNLYTTFSDDDDVGCARLGNTFLSTFPTWFNGNRLMSD